MNYLEDEILKRIEKECLDYQRSGRMKHPNSQVSLTFEDGEIWLCDYDPEMDMADFVKCICSQNERLSIDTGRVRSMCYQHNWRTE